MTTDGPAALYELADRVAFDAELKRILIGKRLHDLADQWKAERERNIRTDWRKCPDCGMDWPHPSETSSFVCPSCRSAADREDCAKFAGQNELLIKATGTETFSAALQRISVCAADRAALAQAQHANDAERGEWSEYYALLTGDRGAWSPDDMRRAVKAQTDALTQAQEALTEDREKWSFDTALYVGALLLAKVYPDDVFTGVSGDPGPTYIAALRDALLTYAQRNTLAQARALLTELYDDSPCRFDHHGHCQEHNSMTDVCIMRRIAAALSDGAR